LPFDLGQGVTRLLSRNFRGRAVKVELDDRLGFADGGTILTLMISSLGGRGPQDLCIASNAVKT